MSKRPVTDNGIRDLVKTVIDGGYCIGCGACTVAEGSPFEIVMNEVGQYEARVSTNYSLRSTLKYDIRSVCPFADGNLNEDLLAREYSLDKGPYTDGIGYALATFAGYVSESDFRERGSSGGLVTWLLCELLEKSLVDAVIHVRESAATSSPDAPLFTMQVSRSVEEVRSGSKSRYYPVEMSAVLDYVKKHRGRYAVVGVPCFVKAIRLLALKEPVIRDRIAFCISLVCGHLKSDRFARLLAWEAGIRPDDLRTIDFRRKLLNRPANRYAVEFITHSGSRKVVPVEELKSYNWGYGLFKYQACDYCDDVVGETADISVGDAWLPTYVSDPLGTNVVVVRNDRVLDLLRTAIQSGRLNLEHIAPDDVVASQDAGIRHRRQGLAYRLYLRQRRNEWFPRKRVSPGNDQLTSREREIHALRMQLRTESHKAFAQALETGNLSTFSKTMQPLIRRYKRLYKPSLFKRIARRFHRLLAGTLKF